jgi:hypothetical protein
MITHDYQLKLIEVNSNPCLEFSSPYLEQFIPKLIEDTFQLTIDEYFPPPLATNQSDMSKTIPATSSSKSNTNTAGGGVGGSSKKPPMNSSLPVPILTKATSLAIETISEARRNNKFKLIYQEERERKQVIED